MKLSRASVGLAVRAAREAASLTLSDLAGAVGMTTASLSRSENGLRDLEFAEVVAIAEAVRIDVEWIQSLAETYERTDAGKKLRRKSELTEDLNDLRRLAIEAAIEARSVQG